YVRVETAIAVGGARRNPVDQVNVDALFDQILDDAAAGLEVEDEGPLDERVDEEQRHAMLLAVAARLVMAQADQARLVDDARARRRRRIVHGRAEAAAKRVERPHRAFHPERRDLVNCRHLRLSPSDPRRAIPTTPRTGRRWTCARSAPPRRSPQDRSAPRYGRSIYQPRRFCRP